VAVIVGSLRRESLSRRLAEAFASLTPELDFVFPVIGDLALFNEDLEATPPDPWTRFRREISAADAVLFVTPEYNRSMPGVLKNAIDVGSRPYGQSVWRGKPGAVISLSLGAIGGFGANHHLRQCMVFLNVPMLAEEAYVGGALALFEPDGQLASPATIQFLRAYAVTFTAWIERMRSDKPSATPAMGARSR
jgi:chromate reductase